MSSESIALSDLEKVFYKENAQSDTLLYAHTNKLLHSIGINLTSAHFNC